MGLGVRVMKGDATGYAYCEDFSFDAMKQAAETAAQIAAGGQPVAPLAVSMRDAPSRYPVAEESLDAEHPGLQPVPTLGKVVPTDDGLDERVAQRVPVRFRDCPDLYPAPGLELRAAGQWR